MRTALIIAALVLAATSAGAQVPQRDRLGARFENDIRANTDALSRRSSGRSYQIDSQNTRMRERLNSSRSGGLRPIPPLR